MVLAHVIDAWTRDADRDRTAFHRATFVGGLAAPAFLFLAGVGSALSASAHRRRGLGRGAIAGVLIKRGLLIFSLAFAFRVQSLVLGLGRPIDLLKVDILNVMGPALVAVALVWSGARTDPGRAVLAVTATLVLAFVAPPVVASRAVDTLPVPLVWYLRPTAGHTNFTLLPWVAFATAGLGLGLAIAALEEPKQHHRVLAAAGTLGVVIVAAAHWASLQPTIYPAGMSTYWGPSPAFFFVRLGLIVLLLPLCWMLRAMMPAALGAPLATLGAASLFAYWVHVELVYGGVAILIKRRVPFELALVATVLGAYALARLVPVARRWVAAPSGRPELVRRLVARLL